MWHRLGGCENRLLMELRHSRRHGLVQRVRRKQYPSSIHPKTEQFARATFLRRRHGPKYGGHFGRTGVYCLQRREQSGRGRACPLRFPSLVHLVSCRGGCHDCNSRKNPRKQLCQAVSHVDEPCDHSASAILPALRPLVLQGSFSRPGLAFLRTRAGCGLIVI